MIDRTKSHGCLDCCYSMKGFEPLWRSLALENPRCIQEFVKANGFTDQEVSEGNIMK